VRQTDRASKQLGEGTGALPVARTLVRDSRDGRIGEVMDRVGHRIALRPEGGGREWFALPEDIAPITAADTLREEVQKVNERQGWYA
jgi:hypothetical protein